MKGWFTRNRIISLVLYLLFIPMWSSVTVLLRAESTLSVYAGVVLMFTYLWVTGWFTYLAFFATDSEEKSTSDA